MDFVFNTENISADFETDIVMLFNADCRNILNNIKNESIDLFVSDIPYKISRKGIAKKKERQKIYGWNI